MTLPSTLALAARRGVGLRFTGTVVHGDARGRLLGFPTANLELDPAAGVPADGVWVAHVEVDEPAADAPVVRRAALSVRTNPTYGGTQLRVEAHLLDFDGDLYGARLTVEVLDRLRGTVAFASEADLVRQIAVDVEAARRWAV